MKRSDEAGKPKRDTPNSENKALERKDKYVRQTRFEERPDEVSGLSDDSSGESGTEARANSIVIEINEPIPQGEQVDMCTQRAPLVDPSTPEIAFK